MRSRYLKTILISLCLANVLLYSSLAWAWTSEVQSRFKSANESYRKGDFVKAVQIYEKLAKEFPSNASFLYNLGNSYYRSGNLALAILNYQRALCYDARNADVRYNLKYAKSLLEYRVDDKRNWYLKFTEEILERISEREAQILVVAAYFILFLSWYFVLMFRRGTPWGWRRKALIVLFGLALLLLFLKNLETRVIRDAVITSREAEVRFGPSESDQVSFRVGGGILVHVVDHREGWSRILLVNGEGGWVKDDRIAEVLAGSGL